MSRVCHVTSVHREEDVRIYAKECVSLAKAGYEVFLVQRGGSYEKDCSLNALMAELRLNEETNAARILFT